MPKCPCCQAELTEAQVKSIWASYCASRIPKEVRAKPWKRHSEKAGLKCRCVDCNKLREIRLAEAEAKRPKPPPPTEEELTWEAIKAQPADYEALIRHEASKIAAARKRRKRQKLNSEKFNLRMKLLRKRAESERLWGKIKEQAKARADEWQDNKNPPQSPKPPAPTRSS